MFCVWLLFWDFSDCGRLHRETSEPGAALSGRVMGAGTKGAGVAVGGGERRAGPRIFGHGVGGTVGGVRKWGEQTRPPGSCQLDPGQVWCHQQTGGGGRSGRVVVSWSLVMGQVGDA